ncbi:hypothetical protein [Corynebacterium sp. BF-R-2]|uniref:hypothetical protein n=1 Tax=Corynebacterium sp. BF-R-2 TaxID=2943494 RepID=UPI00211E86C1|nr:hypothetical protein [Corynebacterium sp. BF-R-2]MCQ9677806.1 hypothetical protein [Corynebacterium sp. BF-R-2]
MTSPSSPYHSQQIPAKPPKRPFYRRWWFWLLVALGVIIAALAILLLTSRADGFANEETKRETWEAYKCDAYGRIDAAIEGTSIFVELSAGDIPDEERDEAIHWSTELQIKGHNKTVGDIIERTNTPQTTNMCTGWLWERQKKREDFWREYEEFTIDDARDSGVVTD